MRYTFASERGEREKDRGDCFCRRPPFPLSWSHYFLLVSISRLLTSYVRSEFQAGHGCLINDVYNCYAMAMMHPFHTFIVELASIFFAVVNHDWYEVPFHHAAVRIKKRCVHVSFINSFLVHHDFTLFPARSLLSISTHRHGVSQRNYVSRNEWSLNLPGGRETFRGNSLKIKLVAAR